MKYSLICLTVLVVVMLVQTNASKLEKKKAVEVLKYRVKRATPTENEEENCEEPEEEEEECSNGSGEEHSEECEMAEGDENESDEEREESEEGTEESNSPSGCCKD